ncbi:MAG: hypothetical protein KDD63_12450, partial [Bacteroidetes bacterium]|nr:hypothetical protein [Bacteroidota bacterium]
MKKKRNFWIGVTVGGLIIGALALMGLPFVVRNSSFLLGFIICLTLIALGLILRSVWAKDSGSEKSSAKKSKHHQSRVSPIIWISSATFLVLGGIVSSYLIHKQNELSKAQTLFQEQILQHQAELIESVKKSSFVL